MIKTIIYDFDGVICDSVDIKTSAFIELYNNYDDSIKLQVQKYHLLNGGISRVRKIEYYEKELLKNEITEDRIKILASKFSELVKNKVIESEYIPGVKDFLEKNSFDYKQYICTGTPNDEILEIAKLKGIDHYFRGIYGSPMSKIEIIKKIINKDKISIENCIFFGDAMTDYEAAKYHKIPFVGIKSNHTVFPHGTFLLNNFLNIDMKIILSSINE